MHENILGWQITAIFLLSISLLERIDVGNPNLCHQLKLPTYYRPGWWNRILLSHWKTLHVQFDEALQRQPLCSVINQSTSRMEEYVDIYVWATKQQQCFWRLMTYIDDFINLMSLGVCVRCKRTEKKKIKTVKEEERDCWNPWKERDNIPTFWNAR